METVGKDTHFFINTEFCHKFSIIQIVFFLEQTGISSGQSLAEYCTALHEEYLLVTIPQI